MDEACHILGVDVVTHLLPLVAEHPVLTPLKITFHQITEKAVQLDPGMVGSGQAAASQAAGGHIEVAALLLHHDIARHLGSTEQRVLGLIDGEGFGDAVFIGGVVIVPAGFQLF